MCEMVVVWNRIRKQVGLGIRRQADRSQHPAGTPVLLREEEVPRRLRLRGGLRSVLLRPCPLEDPRSEQSLVEVSLGPSDPPGQSLSCCLDTNQSARPAFYPEIKDEHLNFDTEHTLLEQDVTDGIVYVFTRRLTGVHHETVSELHRLSTGSTELPRHNYFATLCTRFHNKAKDTIARSANGETSEKLVAKRLALRYRR